MMKHLGEAQEVQSLGGRGAGMEVDKRTARSDTSQCPSESGLFEWRLDSAGT